VVGHRRDEVICAAATAHAQGRLPEAERLVREALCSHPDDPEANLLAGILAVKQGRAEAAVGPLNTAFRSDPASFDAPFWLSMAFRSLGRGDEAYEMARRAADRNPDSEHAQNQLGMCCLDLDRRVEALTCFTRAAEIAPGIAPFFDNLGRALQSVGRNTDAIEAFRRALAIGPVRPGPLGRLGDAYMMEPNPAAAAECARQILRLAPNSVPGHLLLARALIGDGRVAEGAEAAKRVMELAPANAVPVAYYGRALQSLGRIEEADAEFRRSIELEPRQGFAYYSLVHNHRVGEEDRPLVDAMERLLDDQSLPKREIIQLRYGLGKACEDLGEYEVAMRHFDAANRIDHELKVGIPPFEPAQLEVSAGFLTRNFDKAFFERHRAAGVESDAPIFVVGMMRSGTTLAEQILSSHPAVGGAGELLFWPENAGSGQKAFRREGELDVARLRSLASDYLSLLGRVAPVKRHVVDKMNTNYLLLGLLHTAFPNARIIHMRRHPVDTCLSIWATPVANGIDLCADKENVVFAYEQYLRVMSHWRSVLPEDRLLDVQYEELVSDQERVTREMVEFCGLEWDEACMRPQDNTRVVKTPSVWQVRQPIYRTSMARWRKYEPWLGAFAKLL
jgi:tetratricopeptide (TPR) repeat protein